MNFAVSLYRKLIVAGVYLAPVVLLMLRVGWGWELFESGRGHLTHLQDTTSFFQSLDIPQPKLSAMISGTTELVGGVLWMAGLATRPVSILLFFNFCVAYVAASQDIVKHFFTENLSKFVDDTAYPFLVTSLVLFAFGPGLLSIDGILKKTVFKKYAVGL